MSKIISCSKACKIARLSKNTLLRYLRHGDFPPSIDNPKGYFLFWESEIIEWVNTQREKVIEKWNSKRYDEKTRTMNYITELENQLIFDHVVNP